MKYLIYIFHKDFTMGPDEESGELVCTMERLVDDVYKFRDEFFFSSELLEFSQYWISAPPPPFSFLPFSPLLAAALGPLAYSSRSSRSPSL